MAYEVTATKKRPGTFDELEGQDFVVSTLKSSLKTGKIAHAYLFSGPRGVGKTSAARILAKSLNCEKGVTDTPCRVCSNCMEIARGSSLDVIEIDGASNTSVNDIRTIKEEVLFAPNSSRYKVYIIDEVHMLSNSAFNALLKTIEEPPPYIVFIFATTELHKVPATIRSRCQQFNFRLLSIDKIKELLAKAADEMNIEADNDALLWIAREATGSMRDAYTLFDQVVSFSNGSITLDVIREKLGIVGLETIDSLAESIAEKDSTKVLEQATDILQSGVSINQFLLDLTVYFRSILFIKQGISKEAILGFEKKRYSEKVIETFSVIQVEKILEILLELHRNLKYSINRNFELELALSKISVMAEYIAPGEILNEIKKIKQELVNGTLSEQNVTEAPGSEKEKEYSISLDQKVNIINKIKKYKLSLASALEKAVSWKLNGSLLELVFDSTYSANFVKTDILAVKETIQEMLQIQVDIVVTVLDNNSDDLGNVDDSVEMVKRVFRGEVIKGD